MSQNERAAAREVTQLKDSATDLLHSFSYESQRTLLVEEELVPDALLYQLKCVQSSFQGNAEHMFVQCQNRMILLCSPAIRRKS